MSECTTCNLCSKHGRLADAVEVQLVPCHVRALSDQKFTVWRCPACYSLHCKESPNLPYFYDHYPFKNHRLDYHTKVAYGNRLSLLRSLGVKQINSILDFGCGKGLFVKFLQQQNFIDVSGFDTFIPEYSDHKVLTRQYDLVVSHDVIEHVDEPKDFLHTLVNLTKPGGLLIIGTPNAERIPLASGNTLAVELSQPYHRHILSETIFRKMASDQALEVVKVSHRFYFDSLRPFVNTRFMWEYINRLGGMIDAAVEPVQFKTILTSPKLLFYGFFGYFFPPPGNMLFTFKKSSLTPKLKDQVDEYTVKARA